MVMTRRTSCSGRPCAVACLATRSSKLRWALWAFASDANATRATAKADTCQRMNFPRRCHRTASSACPTCRNSPPASRCFALRNRSSAELRKNPGTARPAGRPVIAMARIDPRARTFRGVAMAEISNAKENVKRVFYVRTLNHPCYLEIIGRRPEIRLDKLENDTPDAASAPIIAAAHAYQVSSARDELPARYHVDKALIERAPNLLIISTGGAGYDTVNVKDCTDAGVLVVNQSGGNADAVASHVLAMVLMLSKQIIQTNHALRKGTMKDRNAFTGSDIHGKTIGICGLGNVGRRVAGLCRTLFNMQVLAYDPYLDDKTVA